MDNTKKSFLSVDGNTAAALASYNFTEVAAIYPITPSSPMAELVDVYASQGKKNAFGTKFANFKVRLVPLVPFTAHYKVALLPQHTPHLKVYS